MIGGKNLLLYIYHTVWQISIFRLAEIASVHKIRYSIKSIQLLITQNEWYYGIYYAILDDESWSQ